MATRLVATALLVAASVAATSALAQNKGGRDRQEVCADGSAASTVPGQPPCGQDALGNADGAVALPGLIVDLFPSGPGPDGTPLPEPRPGQTGQGSAGGAPPPPPLVPARAISGAFVPDEVLATIAGGVAEAQAVADAFGLEIRSQRQSVLLGRTLVRFGIPDGRPVGLVIAQLETDPRTLSREANHIVFLQQAGAVANYAFERIALEPGAASGADVRVAVIDTAADEAHPALKGVIAATFDAMPDMPTTDRNHGTSVSGLIAGVGEFRGIAPGAAIYHARAFEKGRSTMDFILAAFDWAAGQDVRVVNMSFVGPPNELMQAACDAARARDIVLVAAAGNNGPGAPWGYPAAYDGVIAVTATDARDGLMQQANRGPYVFVAAPGVDMIAPVEGGADLVTGTSFASAIVAGAIANLLHAGADRSADWVEQALAATATDLGAKGRDDDFGHGLVNYRSLADVR